jgi:hypothetical protein
LLNQGVIDFCNTDKSIKLYLQVTVCFFERVCYLFFLLWCLIWDLCMYANVRESIFHPWNFFCFWNIGFSLLLIYDRPFACQFQRYKNTYFYSFHLFINICFNFLPCYRIFCYQCPRLSVFATLCVCLWPTSFRYIQNSWSTNHENLEFKFLLVFQY